MSSRRQDDHTSVPVEYDSTDRDANFYLFTRPLDDAVLGCSNDITLHHWSLVAVFIDETFRTMEGNESGGKLRPYYFKEFPRDAERKRGKLYNLVPVTTSPSKLREATIYNSLNGTNYSPSSNNCQCWVKNLAKSISSKLGSAVDNYRSHKELNFIESAVKCSFASSVSSSKFVSRSLTSHAKEACEQNKGKTDYHYMD